LCCSRHSWSLHRVLASERDVDIAVAAARKAFRETWGKNVSGFERSRLINKLADLMERDQQILGELECLNNGKPVKIARCVQAKAWETLFLISFLITSETSTSVIV
jgi:acyl-CoA reductase-like NAD-dependent aldehyde dehydrogenase